jgi:hypothetical protein
MHRQARHAFRKTARIPSAGTKSLPQKYFVSREIFAKEQDEFFPKNAVGRASESDRETGPILWRRRRLRA